MKISRPKNWNGKILAIKFYIFKWTIYIFKLLESYGSKKLDGEYQKWAIASQNGIAEKKHWTTTKSNHRIITDVVCYASVCSLQHFGITPAKISQWKFITQFAFHSILLNAVQLQSDDGDSQRINSTRIFSNLKISQLVFSSMGVTMCGRRKRRERNKEIIKV